MCTVTDVRALSNEQCAAVDPQRHAGQVVQLNYPAGVALSAIGVALSADGGTLYIADCSNIAYKNRHRRTAIKRWRLC